MSDEDPHLSNLLRPLRNPPEWPASSESVILEPFVYITSKPGKEIRSLLIEAFNVWLDVPRTQLSVVSRVVRMLHSASLMVDDIQDGAQLRRGQPVAHRIYGVPQTINTANYVYFLAYKELAALRDHDDDSGDKDRVVPNKDLDLVVTEELLSLHRGQGLEIFWRDTLQCPTEEEYIAMVNNKTGGLFRIAVKLMMACATKNVHVDYVPLVNLFGVYFQIRDDYMNLQSTEYSKNKGFAEDLTEGKFSFPIVHGVRADQSNRVILNVLQKRPTTPTLKHHTISHLRNQTGSFSYTLKIMKALEREVQQEIARLGGNIQLEAILATLHVEDDR
ncbi:farnesyltranstransferase [Boletus edulis BED1]|uniref:(2E,6E)-farnesyl diphosphate synthase n=1 Tax=Boletus edulis BED1 TaxID=1328754 RepID=A0AAD4BMM4_BOLED|nr:farnesyltranstransferase [Boletus edulis BED1]